MRRVTTILFFGPLLAACTEPGDPGLPPGQGADETSDTSGGGATTSSAIPDSDSTPADESSTHADESSGAGGATTDTGPSEPACEGTCLAVPPRWHGPVAIQQSAMKDAVPDCPASYPAPVGEWYGDLVADDLLCLCSCEPDEAQCPDEVSLGYYGNGGNCLAVSAGYDLTQSCNSGPAGQIGRWYAASPDVVDGSCTPSSVEIPTVAAFTTRWTLCAGEPEPGACETDESCAAAPGAFEDRLCIWIDGDEPCPAGDFGSRQVIHSAFDDQRDCAECTCGEMSGTCGGSLRLYSDNSCPAGGVAADILTAEVGDCVQYDPQSARLLEDLTPNDDIACDASDGTPIGEAVPTDPITVCCTAEA